MIDKERLMKTLLAGVLALTAAAVVSSAFGDVKQHVDAMKASNKPLVFAVDHGTYTCSSCEPEVKARTDGGAQKVSGHTEYDEIVVAVRSPTTVEVVEELNGKHQAYYNYTVSGDGKTLAVKYTDYSTGKETMGGFTATRIGPAPAGAHAASGSWKIQ
jgi:hypothetical protein